jgi:hypothetical protein
MSPATPHVSTLVAEWIAGDPYGGPARFGAALSEWQVIRPEYAETADPSRTTKRRLSASARSCGFPARTSCG